MAKWVEQAAQCRALVASLGESAGWWRSKAMEPVGIRFLQRLYPRTAHLAAVETASLAARRDHDGAILSHGHFHLFRFPTADEASIRTWIESDEGLARLRAVTEMPLEQRLTHLQSLVNGERAPGTSGPVSCGSVNAVRQGRAIERIAAAYVSAFAKETRVYPYLEESTS